MLQSIFICILLFSPHKMGAFFQQNIKGPYRPEHPVRQDRLCHAGEMNTVCTFLLLVILKVKIPKQGVFKIILHVESVPVEWIYCRMFDTIFIFDSLVANNTILCSHREIPNIVKCSQGTESPFVFNSPLLQVLVSITIFSQQEKLPEHLGFHCEGPCDISTGILTAVIGMGNTIFLLQSFYQFSCAFETIFFL